MKTQTPPSNLMEVSNHEHKKQCSSFETAPFADPELGVGSLPKQPTLQGSRGAAPGLIGAPGAEFLTSYSVSSGTSSPSSLDT